MNKSDMKKLLAIMKALIKGRITIDVMDKTAISRTPGDVTNVGHN
jgi:hypothetical protein